MLDRLHGGTGIIQHGSTVKNVKAGCSRKGNKTLQLNSVHGLAASGGQVWRCHRNSTSRAADCTVLE